MEQEGKEKYKPTYVQSHTVMEQDEQGRTPTYVQSLTVMEQEKNTY